MPRFTTVETQPITVTFQLNAPVVFSVDTEDSDTFARNLLDTVLDGCDGDIQDFDIVSTDFDEEILQPNVTYTISGVCTVGISGTCDYDPGRTYGDPYDCYPESIDNVEYEDGMITFCNLDMVKDARPDLSDIQVIIGETTYDGEIELDDDDYSDDDGPEYDRYDRWDD